MSLLTLEQLREVETVRVFIHQANEYLGRLGYTEHGPRHVDFVARLARDLLLKLSYSPRQAELAAMAGYLHDIGNVTGRKDHAQAGSLIAFNILREQGMPAEEIAEIISAIGNHDEGDGRVVNPVSAALILADKSDVHRSRVRNPDFSTFDIHDRVNYAVEESKLEVDPCGTVITLNLTIDTEISQVMEYFEIFLSRMILCRRAADFLKTNFALIMNGTKLL